VKKAFQTPKSKAYPSSLWPNGLEVIIGMSKDAQFGPVLMFGLGGIFVEIIKDAPSHCAFIEKGRRLKWCGKSRGFRC